MPPIVTDQVAWSVGLSPSERCKTTAEAIEMPFVLRTRVGPRNHLLDIAERFQPNTVYCGHSTQYSHLVYLLQVSYIECYTTCTTNRSNVVWAHSAFLIDKLVLYLSKSPHSTLQNFPQFITDLRFLQYSTVSQPYESRTIYQMQPVTTCAASDVRFAEISKSYACRTKLIDREILLK